MRKIILIAVILFILGGLIFGSYKAFLKSGICETRQPLIRMINRLCPPTIRSSEDVVNAKKAVICNWKKHSCDYFNPQANSGNLKIIIMVNGKPGRKIEVNLWTLPQPGGNDETYTKYTDDKGIAFFEGITPGSYYPNYNLNGFPKEYGEAYMTWSSQKVEVTKNITQEVKLNLTQKQ